VKEIVQVLASLVLISGLSYKITFKGIMDLAFSVVFDKTQFARIPRFLNEVRQVFAFRFAYVG
jgi:hypothetical protein